MTNSSWKNLIASEFGVSKSMAADMFHAMLEYKKHKESSMSCCKSSNYDEDEYTEEKFAHDIWNATYGSW